jgi:succinate-semialdehyde dehydrogenase/glutarate-semialdehyde dehydrogenase
MSFPTEPEVVTRNPATGAELSRYATHDEAGVEAALAQTHAAAQAWRDTPLEERLALLRGVGKLLTERREEYAALITAEMGKPITQSRREAQGYSEEFLWFLDNAEEALKPEVTHEDEQSIHRITYEPYGTAAVITPWNYPYGMAVWGIVPNLVVGNTVVFKISEETPMVGKLLAEIFGNHDLPAGAFGEVYGAGETGRTLSEGDINLIWFTGSTRTGKSLFKTAGEKFIKSVMEMGGSNPCVVFEDADIEAAAELIYSGRFDNCGQVCDAIKRLIVHDSIKQPLMAELARLLKTKRVGAPTDEATDISSLVAKRQLDLLEAQVQDAVAQGAKITAQLTVPDGLRGAFYPPTLLDGIKKSMRVWTEEVFGPVLPVVTFKTEDEAVALANDTPYGLGSRVISADKTRAERVAGKIDAGTVEVNQGDRWLTCNPFGGYKNSGMGREHGMLGLRELCQIKVISSSK